MHIPVLPYRWQLRGEQEMSIARLTRRQIKNEKTRLNEQERRDKTADSA